MHADRSGGDGTVRDYRPILALTKPVTARHPRWHRRGQAVCLWRLWEQGRSRVPLSTTAGRRQAEAGGLATALEKLPGHLVREIVMWL